MQTRNVRHYDYAPKQLWPTREVHVPIWLIAAVLIAVTAFVMGYSERMNSYVVVEGIKQ